MRKYRGWKAAPAAPRRRDVSRLSNVAQQVHAAPSSRFQILENLDVTYHRISQY